MSRSRRPQKRVRPGDGCWHCDDRSQCRVAKHKRTNLQRPLAEGLADQVEVEHMT